MGKGKKKKTRVHTEDYSIWDSQPKRIAKVHIVSNGILTLCKATTIDGVDEFYNWDCKPDREMIRRTATPEVEVVVDSNVIKGWEYDG